MSKPALAGPSLRRRLCFVALLTMALSACGGGGGGTASDTGTSSGGSSGGVSGGSSGGSTGGTSGTSTGGSTGGSGGASGGTSGGSSGGSSGGGSGGGSGGSSGGDSGGSSGGSPVACNSSRWVTAWQAPPTDATTTADPGLRPLTVGANQSYRLIFTALGHGSTARVHLSNRFGLAPIVFSGVRLAHRSSGAAIDATTSVALTFNGAANVTLQVGEDVISDPVSFVFNEFDDLAVSIAAINPGIVPTLHFVARQTSYVTAPGAGDHSADVSGSAYTQSTTSRPFVVGFDTLASGATSAVVAFGDSLTDGFQGPPQGLPENTATVNRNERYPDFLAHRLVTASRTLFVANAGITGNRVRENGSVPAYGPSALSRVDSDVLAQAGVSDVILFEGINDIGQTVGLSASQLTDAYTQLIASLHGAGLHVVQATLTPSGGNAQAGYSSTNASTLRQEVNSWIRTQSPADAVVDFDAAVRDSSNPNLLAAQYDGGDGLHLNASGYQKLAATVDLNSLQGSNCTP